MLASILESLAGALGAALDGFVNSFLNVLNLSLADMIEVFPLLPKAYDILQWVAIGLTAIVAGYALATFGMASINSGGAQDSPIGILMRTLIAVIGIYFGGYILEYALMLAKIPYGAFSNLDPSSGSHAVNWSGMIAGLAIDAVGGAAGRMVNLTIAIAEILLIFMIAWNLFKLCVEICERWLMVGILVYFSPLAYASLPSNATTPIFKKYFGMYIGALIQMALSVLFLKLIVSGFSNFGNSG